MSDITVAVTYESRGKRFPVSGAIMPQEWKLALLLDEWSRVYEASAHEARRKLCAEMFGDEKMISSEEFRERAKQITAAAVIDGELVHQLELADALIWVRDGESWTPMKISSWVARAPLVATVELGALPLGEPGEEDPHED